MRTNTATFTAECISEPVTASHTINVADFADVRIIKSMSPNPVTDGSVLTYTFTLYNYGNIPATNVVLTDAFTPAPTNISVSVNGGAVAADYSYVNGVFTLPAAASSFEFTIPAATFSQDPFTGAVVVTPGTSVITVSGTI